MSPYWIKELTSRINKAVKLTWQRRPEAIAECLKQAYLLGANATLRVGDKVIETGECGTKGFKGVIVFSVMADDLAVTWENDVTTSITLGTRRIEDG